MAVMVSVRSVFLLLFMCAFGLAHRLQGVHQSGLAPDALCLQSRLLRESHIIPEFLHRTLYDDIHRYNTFGLQGSSEVGLEQKGEREYLLCDECEQRFSDYERYAAVFYRGAIMAFSDTTRSESFHGKLLKFTRRGSDGKPTTATVPALLHVEGVDYVQLKLFLLSLLWRMGVSNLYFFREVVLGPHEEKIRNMLLNNDPGNPDLYPCQLRLVEFEHRLLTDCQLQPRKGRFNSMTFYRLFSTGVRFDFWVSNQAIHSGEVELYCIKRQQEFVWFIESIHKNPDLVAELIKFGTEINLDQWPK